MYRVDENLCTGCAVCLAACPQQAITLVDSHASIQADLCKACGSCAEVCPQGAIEWVESTVPVAPSQVVTAKPVTPSPAMTDVVVSRPLSSPATPRATGLWQNQIVPVVSSALLWAGRQLLTGVLTELNRRAAPGQRTTTGWTSTSYLAGGGRAGGRRYRRGRLSGWPRGSARS